MRMFSILIPVSMAVSTVNEFNLRFFNDSCTQDSMEEADRCVGGCETNYISCWIGCDGDQDCSRHCAAEQEDCLIKCPCHLMCPTGCPCEEFQCQRCEDLHGNDMEECNAACVNLVKTCMDGCAIYDSACERNCVEENYESCISECPCWTGNDPVPTSTTVATTTTLPTSTSLADTTTTKAPSVDMADVLFDIPTTWLRDNHFVKYLKAASNETRLGERKFPPTTEGLIFIGCGRTEQIDDVVQIGAVMSYSELFNRKYYPSNIDTNAQPVKNFFTYDSSSREHPFGFSAEKKIYLSHWDRHDCKNIARCDDSNNLQKDRLSVLDDSSSNSLFRCGEFNAHSDSKEFGRNFHLVMYHRNF